MIFGEIAERMKDRRRPMDDIGQYVLDRIDEGFAYEEDPEGNEWPELDEDYLRYRKKGPSILTESRRMRDSFRKKREGANKVIIGGAADIPYLRAHQLGYDPGNLPAREHTGATQKDAKHMASIMLGHFKGERQS